MIESKLRADLILGGVRGVRLQKRLDEYGHPFDVGIDDTDLLVEADGSGHREWERFQMDCEDGVEASLEDHEVLRFTGWQIMNRSEWVVAVVKARVKVHRQRRAKAKAKLRAARSRASTAASTQKSTSSAHVRS